MVIKISNPPSFEIIPGTCTDARQGTLQFNQQTGDGWNYRVIDQGQKLVAAGNTVSAEKQILPDGNYSLVFSNNHCGEIEKTFVLISDAAVSAEFSSVYLGQNTWQFTVTNNPSGNCHWDFGAGETLTSRQQTVTHTFADNQLKEVSLTVDNGICSETVKQTLSVTAQQATGELGIFAADNYLVLQSVFEDNVNADIKIYSASGALLLELNQTPINPGQTKIVMPELAKGIYLVRIMANGLPFEQKIAF
jgi:PKD repeat protein